MTTLEVQTLSDGDLDTRINELHVEQERREQVKVKEKDKRIRKVLSLFAVDNHRLLDAVVPDHTPGRYGRKCWDSNTIGGLVDIDPKDWHCLRCLLLDGIEIVNEVRGDDLPEGFEVLITIQGYNIG